MNPSCSCSVLLLGFALISTAWGQEEKPMAPSVVAATVQGMIPKVRPGCVAIRIGGSASGVVISADGWVLTAGHVLMDKALDTEATVFFPDGTKAKARSKGYDLDSDFGLLKLDGDRIDWPHATLAEQSVPVGGFVFTLAHPSGRLKGRPAQVRLGRVTARPLRDGEPWLMVADLDIQPGDSGGPLFDLEGKLVGIDSSAGSPQGFNRFPVIECFKQIRVKLEQSKRSGAFEDGPGGSKHHELKIGKKVVDDLTVLLQERMKAGHRPTAHFVMDMADDTGEARIDAGKLVNFLVQPALSLSNGESFGYGTDDPALISELPVLAAVSPGPLALYVGKEQVALAVHVAPGEFVTKASRLPEGDAPLKVRLAKSLIGVDVVRVDEDYDLAILRAAQPVDLPHVEFPEKMPRVEAATPLMGRDVHGLVFWNIATDEARLVTKKRSIGPVSDKAVISNHRAPYPMAIRHALPLFAEDSATPVYDFEGRFVGIHIARFSRTMGLIVPADVLRERLEISR